MCAPMRLSGLALDPPRLFHASQLNTQLRSSAMQVFAVVTPWQRFQPAELAFGNRHGTLESIPAQLDTRLAQSQTPANWSTKLSSAPTNAAKSECSLRSSMWNLWAMRMPDRVRNGR